MAELRNYQLELLQKVLHRLETDDRKRVMMQLPTGGGKTVIVGALLAELLKGNRRAVWLTHRRELVEQTGEMLNRAGVRTVIDRRWPVGEEAQARRGSTVILMAQTTGSRASKGMIWGGYNANDLMVIDEAHHVPAKRYAEAMEQWPGMVLGMTATPWRLSEKEGFDHLFSQLVCGPRIADLQARGALCKAKVLVPSEGQRIKGGRPGQTGDYIPSGITRANESRVMTAEAVNVWKRYAADRPTIAYAVSKEHARNLQAFFQDNDNDIRAEVILSNTERERRRAAIDGFKRGYVRVLINVLVATEGFDLPDASCVLMTRPTKSLALYLQMVGRGLRPKPDGGDCLILDLAGNALEHGLPEAHRSWSLAPRGKREAPPPTEVIDDEVSETGGKTCGRCGRLRGWRHWEYEHHCGDAHDLVCDLCHIDAHIEAHLPVNPHLTMLVVPEKHSEGLARIAEHTRSHLTMNLLDVITRDNGNLPPGPIRAIGIDLGTTNSTVTEVVWDPQSGDQPTVRCLEIEQSIPRGSEYTHHLVPSVVAIIGGELFIGEGAKRMIGNGASHPRNVFYNCKNDIGLRRTYHQAPEGYRSAKEIAGKILAFLRDAAQTHYVDEPQSVTITVPASFQMTQRNDTLEAARIAKIDVVGGDLLDEPVAAFIDYLISHQGDFHKTGNLLVFDFGGGTCDIGVFRIDPERLEISELSVSRYHRLGGSDITTAIVHQVLIPQLIEQNDVQPNDLSYTDRKLRLEPALLGIAEALKTQLCEEINRLQRLGLYHSAEKSDVIRTQPGGSIELPEVGELTSERYALSAADFENVLKPFLDMDRLDFEETEYQSTCSIFAPIEDALDRAGIAEEDVDYCLLVGGSTIIPQMRSAIQEFLPSTQVLKHRNSEDTQVAIAKGAAYNALSMAIRGRPVIQPVSADDISIRTGQFPIKLISRGARLPYPADNGWEEELSLATPRHDSIADPTELRVEIVAGDEEELICSQTWQIPPTVEGGTRLRLKFRYDGNKALHFELSLAENTHAGSEVLRSTIENPVSHVINPNAIRENIDWTEEALRTGDVETDRIPATLAQLSRDYASLGQTDKAIDFLIQAIRRKERADASFLNSLGILYQDKRDLERARQAYRDAAEANLVWSAPMFNLALLELRDGRLIEAGLAIQSALARQDTGPNQTLAADIYQAHDRNEESQSALVQAFRLFGDVSAMTDWELSWYRRAAVLDGNNSLIEQCDIERRRRNRFGPPGGGGDGELPGIPRSPFIIKLAARFIPDPEERSRYIDRETYVTNAHEKPLLYIADTAEDELTRLSEILRERLRLQSRGKTAVLLPTRRQATQFARRLSAIGIEADTQDKIDFNNNLPKVLTYADARGLIFDSVLLPRLVANSFQNDTASQIQGALCDVIGRATKWAYLSATIQDLLPELVALLPLIDSRDLVLRQTEAAASNDDHRQNDELDILL